LVFHKPIYKRFVFLIIAFVISVQATDIELSWYCIISWKPRVYCWKHTIIT